MARPTSWVGGAATPTVEPRATVRVNGVVDASPPTATVRPDGTLSILKSTVFGSIRTESRAQQPGRRGRGQLSVM